MRLLQDLIVCKDSQTFRGIFYRRISEGTTPHDDVHLLTATQDGRGRLKDFISDTQLSPVFFVDMLEIMKIEECFFTGACSPAIAMDDIFQVSHDVTHGARRLDFERNPPDHLKLRRVLDLKDKSLHYFPLSLVFVFFNFQFSTSCKEFLIYGDYADKDEFIIFYIYRWTNVYRYTKDT